MKLRFKVKVREGELIPAWFGVAWHSFYEYEAVCFPIGFNILAALVRRVYLFIKWGHVHCAPDPRAAYDDGVYVGHRRRDHEIERHKARIASLERAVANGASWLREVGDDYPGSSCQKWCHQKAAALDSEVKRHD